MARTETKIYPFPRAAQQKGLLRGVGLNLLAQTEDERGVFLPDNRLEVRFKLVKHQSLGAYGNESLSGNKPVRKSV